MQPSPVPSSEAGMTLMEVMVTLAIIGVMSGVAVLGLGGPGRSAGSEAEARRLASRLRLAADETLVTSEGLALEWSRDRYGFVRWDAAARRWVPSDVEALGAHKLPPGLTLQGDGASTPALIAVDGAGPPITLALEGRAGSWQVAFDGLNVATTPLVR